MSHACIMMMYASPNKIKESTHARLVGRDGVGHGHVRAPVRGGEAVHPRGLLRGDAVRREGDELEVEVGGVVVLGAVVPVVCLPVRVVGKRAGSDWFF